MHSFTERAARHSHTDLLGKEVRSCVDGLADIIVSSEGKDLGSAAGPHRPAVQ